ncbi:hypothetical protein Ddye_009905 [Dipteronia dyeriana]|uniref:Reverse transcriptase domain-containing protein n=1 Tax=Dipteronia dyeriana TaxID=168575 RepID=A0AAD9XCJ8_9ROSI|nr:hypothetical protein Ddye_009905 [Dipteronia dyeriana]
MVYNPCLDKREERLWRQKLRVRWWKEGFRNSSFFNVVASGRQRRNHLNSISFKRVKVSDPIQVRNGVVNYFKNHFSNVRWKSPIIRGLTLKQASEIERKALEELFSEEEVWDDVCDCDGIKAPGPDSLNVNFIKANWEVIQEDCMMFIHEFYRNGNIVKDLNKIFVALIPKCSNPESMTDFRPISLVSSLYNILAKMLANRLKVVMNYVIGDYQMAFVKDRKILDSFVIANEIIHSWRNDRVGGILVKLDFEKAYDSVNHSFLDSILENMGFGFKWRQWLRCCISTPSLAVLVNGSSTEEFCLERGLRQGDPLSLFLFNIVVECLSCCFKKALVLNLFKGAYLGPE